MRPCRVRPGGIRSLLPVAVLLSIGTAPAMACDPDCGTFVAVLVGAPTAAATTLLVPAIAMGASQEPHYPYRKALGLTALASIVGVVIATASADSSDPSIAPFVALPLGFGIAATAWVSADHSRNAKRSGVHDPGSAPEFAFGWMPAAGGGMVGMMARF